MLRADLILINDRCVTHSFPFNICLDVTVYGVLLSISLSSPFLCSCSLPPSLRVSPPSFLSFSWLPLSLSLACSLPLCVSPFSFLPSPCLPPLFSSPLLPPSLSASLSHSDHRFPVPSSQERCGKPVLGVCFPMSLPSLSVSLLSTPPLSVSLLSLLSLSVSPLCLPPISVSPKIINTEMAHLHFRAQELCESRGGRPGLQSLISLRFLWT